MKKFSVLLASSLALTLGLGLATAPDANAYLVYGPGYTEPEISDPHCTLTAKDPYPVVLIHGTWASTQKWKYLAPALRRAGMCVWGLNFGYDPDAYFYKYQKGQYGTGSVESSIKEIDAYVKKVMKKTGAKKVNVVSHSLGGLLVKIWLNQYKANRYVNNAVLITPTLHGTDMRGIGRIGVHSYPLLPDVLAFVMSKPAAYQLYDSPTIAYANSLPDTMPGVNYVSLMTKDDQTATPYTTGMMKPGPGAGRVQNMVIQDVCRVDHEMTHSGIVEDPIARPVIIRGLRAQTANCKGTPWAVPDGYVGASHVGEDNGFKGDADSSDEVIR